MRYTGTRVTTRSRPVLEPSTCAAQVAEVIHKKDSVLVRYRQHGAEREVHTRCVVLATPASVSHRVAVDLDDDIRQALSRIEYGPFVSAAFLTNETDRQPWDDIYAIATPKRSFNVVLNVSNNVHGYTPERQPGSSLMAFSPAGLARQLLEQDDDTILKSYLEDLDAVLPGTASHLVEAEVARWHEASPYCFPGRAKLQPALTRRSGRVMLAGDYLGTQYTESAVHTGFTAAEAAAQVLATERSERRSAARPPKSTAS